MVQKAESDQLRAAVERTIAGVLAERVPALTDEISRRVLEAITAVPAASDNTSGLLNTAVTCIQGSTTQAEILAAMLDGIAGFCGRAALFVLRDGVAQGWQARGLPNNDGIKALTFDGSTGLAGQAVQTRATVAGSAGDFDSRFRSSFGAPVEDNVLVLPLVIRHKVAALVYADTGTLPGGKLDASAVELLVRAASVWVELAAARRAGAVPLEAPPAAKTMAANAASVIPATAATPVAPLPAPSVPAVSTVPQLSPELDEVHRKARRFAKLLVEEIKLYNQAKVTQGREKRDIYSRLKDDIEKSRASYDKRYGQTPAASADYFKQELIRILANSDVSLMGVSFPG